MLRKVFILAILAMGLCVTYGCTAEAGFSPTQNLRRVMIAGEELKVTGEDFQRAVGLDEYPMAGYYNH